MLEREWGNFSWRKISADKTLRNTDVSGEGSDRDDDSGGSGGGGCGNGQISPFLWKRFSKLNGKKWDQMCPSSKFPLKVKV